MKNEPSTINKYQYYDLFNYVERVGNCNFDQVNFNIIDALIFATLSYYYFDFMKDKENSVLTLDEVVHIYQMYPDLMYEADIKSLRNDFLSHLIKYPRYKNLEISNFVHKISIKSEQQFCALSIKLNQDTVFISYGGTDASLIGFKEDFNMSFLKVIPSQTSAKEYIKNPYFKKFKNIYIGGHSKGGNLSLYAGLTCENTLYRRIKTIFNFDGPGLSHIENNTRYKNMEKKVISIVPNMSMVGMIFTDYNDTYVIESYNTGLMQHDSFSWKIDDKNHFIFASHLSRRSKCLNKSLQKYFANLTNKERKAYIDIWWLIVKETDAKDVFEFRDNLIGNFYKMIKIYTKLTKDEKAMFKKNSLYFLKALKDETLHFNDEEFAVQLGKESMFDYFHI